MSPETINSQPTTARALRVWVVNPFEELPLSGQRLLRYGTLCRVLAERGHDVVWWSSDFSHLTKKRREAPEGHRPTCPSKLEERRGKVDAADAGLPYQIRMIPTPPYKRHVGLARWRNHRAFERGFFRFAKEAVESGEMDKPDLIVVSLPPLAIAREAFRLRELWGCKVVVDIVDAWPETFLRLIPGGERIGRLLLRPLFAQAEQAYCGADGIASVARTFLELPRAARSQAPVHVTYVGAEVLERSARSGERREKSESESESDRQRGGGQRAENEQPETRNTNHQTRMPLRFVYIGAMARSYDLETVMEAAEKLKAAGCRFEIHLAGAGPKEAKLREFARTHDLETEVVFHGYLGAEELAELLAESDVALNPIFSDSWIVFPYKVSEYLCAGLPVINSLPGELRTLLGANGAGGWYPMGNHLVLAKVMKEYCLNSDKAKLQGLGARALARKHFDRSETYPELAEFLERIATEQGVLVCLITDTR